MRKLYFFFLFSCLSFIAYAQFPAPYCNVVFNSGVEPITKVQFAGINNSSPANINGTPALEDFLSITGTVEQAGVYTITVEGNSDGNFPNYYRVFFDWNRDNDFEDAGEMYEIGVIINSTGIDGKIASTAINVPATAGVGNTRMRVIKKYGATNPLTSPCNPTGSVNYGQAEDYTISVTLGNVCTGTPTGGTAVASPLILCTADTSVLTVTGFSSGTGISFQWESSPAGANNFTNVVNGTGATTSTYTSGTISANTDFRCKITCTNGGAFSYSTISTVTLGSVPTNDEACNAISLVLNGTAHCGNTTCATAVGDPAFSSSAANNTVWYKFTPPTTGLYNIIMSRPSGVTSGLLNAWIGIYSQINACPNLALFQQPATTGYDLTVNPSVTVVTPTLSSDSTYYFMIDGNSGSAGAYCIQIVTPPAPPTTCVTNTLPANNATGVVYAPNLKLKWNTVPGALSYDVLIGTTNPPTAVLANVTTDSILVTGVAASTTYFWYVVPKNLGGGAVGCTANVTSFTTDGPPAAPTNDDCAGAINISAYGGVVNGTTIAATQSLPAIICGGFTGTANDDVWYRFTALSNGTAVITLTGVGSFDAVLEGFSGNCGSLTSLTCADAVFSGTNQVEVLTMSGLTAGQAYYIRVYSWASSDNARGTFTLSASGAALPASITSFKGEKRGITNVLSWTTTAEVNNAGFELQRSNNGVQFSSLSFIQSKGDNGNSNQAIAYSYNDEKPFIGTNYYRLKQIDKDGKFLFSEVIAMKGAKPNQLDVVAIYPNPTTHILNIALNAPKTDKVTFVISDISGRTILTQQVNVIVGDNVYNINVASLAKGTYTVKAICNTGCETAITKFVKQ
jgi:hypothetical protein